MNRLASMLRRPHSIRTLLISLVLAVSLPALLVGLWVVGLTKQLTREGNQRLLEESARALSMVLDLELAQRGAVVRALALSRMLDAAPDIAPDTLRAFDDQARRTLTGLEGWLEVRSANRVLVNTRMRPGEVPRTLVPTSAIALSDTPQIQPLTKNETLGIQHAALVQPVLRNGRAVLNLTLTMMPHEFQRIIDQQNIRDDWVATILDSEGRVVARHPGGAAYAGRQASADLLAELGSARAGLLHSKTLDGQDSTIYFSTSSQGWTYLTGMPRSQFEGVVPANMKNFALGTLMLLTLAVLAALVASRAIVRPIQVIKRLAHDMQGGQPVQGSATGITECDEVSEAMAKASRAIHGAQVEMEHRVEQAVALTRHAQDRMAHSQRLEALGRLTGGVAHDFNNLLGVISNSGHLILRKTRDPQLTAPVEVCLRAVETGSRLTQHLLRFAGRQSVRPCSVALATFVPEAAELIRALMGQRVTLSMSIDPGTPAVFADPSELELALINLALNARDAIVGSGRVELRTARADGADCADLPEGDYVVIALTDDGGGISDDIVQRVFEPFFSTKDPAEATGLGLSQVYGFCRQSGGNVRLDSTPGLGTSVTMILPAHGADKASTPLVDGEPLIVTAGTRVLLVEDNEELRNVTSVLLGSFGCHVVSTASAQDALKIIQDGNNIDVMLTDVHMPGPMNGVSLARQARTLSPGMPVVLISGNRGDVGDKDGFPFVQKPYTPEALMAALQQAMAP